MSYLTCGIILFYCNAILGVAILLRHLQFMSFHVVKYEQPPSATTNARQYAKH